MLYLVLQDFIISDLKTQYDLAVSWLYHEYARDTEGDQYDLCLTSLLEGAKATLEPRDRLVVRSASVCAKLCCGVRLFSKLVLDAPRITANALQIIKSFCDDEVSDCVYAWMCTCLCLYVHMCIYVCLCVCLCTCISLYHTVSNFRGSRLVCRGLGTQTIL